MTIKKAHCLFEQSGTFKNEFIKLGIPAIDYDIQNDYGQTDVIIDLFDQIRGGYEGKESIFDSIDQDDIIIAFFPCVRFSAIAIPEMSGRAWQHRKNWNDADRLNHAMKMMDERKRNFDLISKMFLICIKRGLRMIVENPYTQPHYLTLYFPIRPAVIDTDRTDRGDKHKKPTQYWFVGCKPENNIIMESMEYVEVEIIDTWDKKNNQKLRSEIHPQYANRFIREFILDADYEPPNR